MAFINFQPKNYFNTKLWTGTGAENAISSVGFQPDFTWIKRREVNSHRLFDAVRGATKFIESDSTAAEVTDAQELKSFDSDGFTLGTATKVNASAGTYASWNWRASNTTAVSNTDGSITSTVSANTTSGFSIVSYTGTSSAETVGHGLGVAPNMIIVKPYSVSQNWSVFHSSVGNTYYGYLDTTDAFSNSPSTVWNSTINSTVFGIGSGVATNVNSASHIAYCFAEKKGFSKFGSYVGNGNADGAFIYTGFKPAFVLIKCSSAIGDWQLIDSTRSTFNVCNLRLQPNSSGAEAGSDTIDICSNGFKQRNTFGNFNTSGATYIYMAFAEAPLVSSNGVPATAR